MSYIVGELEFTLNEEYTMGMWYHTFTDNKNQYVFSFNQEFYDEDEAWEAIEAAIRSKEDLNNDI